MIVDNKYI